MNTTNPTFNNAHTTYSYPPNPYNNQSPRNANTKSPRPKKEKKKKKKKT